MNALQVEARPGTSRAGQRHYDTISDCGLKEPQLDNSVVAQPLQVFHGKKTTDNRPQPVPAVDSFDSFCQWVQERTPAREKGLDYFTGAFREGQPEGKPRAARWRCKALAEPRAYLPLDFDGIPDLDHYQRLVAYLTYNYDCITYTTASHLKPGKGPRCRAVLNISRPVDDPTSRALGYAVECELEAQGLGGEGWEFDKSVYGLAQPCYLPTQGSEIKRGQGAVLDVDAMLDRWPMPAPAPSRARVGVGGEVLDPERLADLLDHIAPENEYDPWLHVCMAIHSASGGSEEGLAAAHAWSERGDNYDAGELDVKWRGFGGDGGYTSGTLYHLARKGGWKPPLENGGIDPRSGLGLAMRFARDGEDDFAWTPSHGWVHRTAEKWIPDEGLARLTLVKDICTELAPVDKDTGHKKGRLLERNTWNTVLAAAEGLAEVRVDANKWDSKPWIVHGGGGAYHLRTGAWVPDRWNMHAAACAPDFEATPTRWLQFIDEVTGGDGEVAEFLHRLAGYCLTGSVKEQKMFFLWGTGANGKSVFLDTLRDVMGDYCYVLDSKALTTAGKSMHQEVFAQIKGKRLVISSEIAERARWDQAKLKQLTGDGHITANLMRENSVTFQSQATLLIAANHQPRFHGGDKAMGRRMVLVPFTQDFEGRADLDLLDKLRAERAGILAWMIEGAGKWYKDGLQVPESIKKASREYLKENDDIGEWLDERCVMGTGPEFEELSADAYKDFKEWKEARGERPPAQKLFKALITQRAGLWEVRHDNRRYLAGFHLA